VYGQEKHFESVAFAMQVYTFADRMQMEILMNELDKYFKQCAVVSEFFALFEMYRCLGREEGLLWCRRQVCVCVQLVGKMQ
jgi:hypothetical protein